MYDGEMKSGAEMGVHACSGLDVGMYACMYIGQAYRGGEGPGDGKGKCVTRVQRTRTSV
jgi:hypothetical protein